MSDGTDRDRRQPVRRSWPAACPTSATSRCARGAGWPRRCAARGVEVAERDVDAACCAALRADPPGLRGPDAARRDRRGRRDPRGPRAARPRRTSAPGRPPAAPPSTSRSPRRSSRAAGHAHARSRCCLPHETFRELGAAAVMDGAGRPARAAADGQAGQERLGARLHGRARPPRSCPPRWSTPSPTATWRCSSSSSPAPRWRSRCIDDGAGPRALPAVGIRPDGGVYDYTARYTAGATEFVVPAELPRRARRECARVAVTAHEALGLRDLSRSDLIVDADGDGVVPRGQRGARVHRDLDGAAVDPGRRARPRQGAAPRWSGGRGRCAHAREPSR